MGDQRVGNTVSDGGYRVPRVVEGLHSKALALSGFETNGVGRDIEFGDGLGSQGRSAGAEENRDQNGLLELLPHVSRSSGDDGHDEQGADHRMLKVTLFGTTN